MSEVASCRGVRTWLKQHLGARCLAPCTGQDLRALSAFVHLLELHAVSDATGRDAAIVAMQHVVSAVQPSLRWLFKESIPYVLDWEDEDRIWRLVVVP